MTISLRTIVPAIAAALFLAGCAGTSTTTTAATGAATSAPAATTSAPATTTAPAASPSASKPSAGLGATRPPGSKVVVDKANGYQLALPNGYIRITSKAQLAKVYKAGASAAAKAGLTQQLLNKTLKVIAIRPDTGDSVNVVVTSSGFLTADQLPEAEPALRSQLAKVGAKKIVFKKTTLGGDPALRGAYTVTLGGRKIPTVQYITVHDDKAYTLTLSQPVQASAKIEKQTVGSWRFL